MKYRLFRKGLVFGMAFLLLLLSVLAEGNVLVSKKTVSERLSNPLREEADISHSLVQWTIMYYMCGDSNMHDYTKPLLENLSKIGSTKDLNIVALKDNLKVGDSKLYYINETGEKIELNEKFGWPDEVDTSNPNTFELFCKQMMGAYPAKYYAFITYASGGTGWQLYCFHDESNGRIGLTIPAFANSLKNITDDGNRKLDVLYTSCCMSMIELAYEISPYVDYIVTTQEHISGDYLIQRYYEATWDLKNNTNMTPEEFAKRAPFRHKAHTFQYSESYGIKLSPLTKILDKLPFPGLHTVIMHSSVSVVNLSRIHDLVRAVHNLSSFLILHSHNENVTEAIKVARTNVREYGKAYPKFWIFYPFCDRLPLEIFSYDCHIDLYNFVELLGNNAQHPIIKNLCSSVMEKINESIPAIKKVPDDPSYGLSIYFPSSKIMYNKYILGGKIPLPYEELQFSKDTSWDNFLCDYLGID